MELFGHDFLGCGPSQDKLSWAATIGSNDSSVKFSISSSVESIRHSIIVGEDFPEVEFINL